MVLQNLLGDEYQIIEEGQNGRTIANSDPWEWGCKCGMDYILPMVESHKPFAPFFDVDTVIENSKRLAYWYELVAKQFDCEFLDAAAICKAGEADSLHLMEEGHKDLAEGIYRKIREIV